MKDWFPIIPNLHVISYGFLSHFPKIYGMMCTDFFWDPSGSSDKANYRPVNYRPLLSKLSEKNYL